MLSQAALEVYIKSGMFERYKEKIKASYFLTVKCLTSSLEKKFDSCNNIYKYNPLEKYMSHTYIELNKKIS